MPRTWQSLVLPPGIVKAESSYSQEGRYIDSEKVRFVRGMPEKIGGYLDLDVTYLGVCRGLLPWIDNSEVTRAVLGTHIRLYLYTSTGIINITPARASGSLTSAFSTVNGSPTVTVAHTNHGLSNGTYVTFTNGTAIGGSGITLAGDYAVTVTGANSYTVTHGSNASATVNNAGNADYVYEINIGFSDVTPGFGYGVGLYGSGFYGTPRTSSITLHARTWTIDVFGEDPVACPRGGNIYYWDASVQPDRAELVTNAPTNNQAVFVTAERHLVAVGADGDPMKMAWSDTEDMTDWTPSISNDAGDYNLSGGSTLLTGKRMRNHMNLIWSNTDCFVMRYTADQFVFSFEKQGSNAGLVGPHAVVEFEGIAYWMSDSGFMMWNGFVQSIPQSLDIRDFVYDDINKDQSDKIHAGVVADKSEVWFFYPTAAADEIDRYAMYSIRENVWTTGTFIRTAWVDNNVYQFPLATDASNLLYYHEYGVDADGAAMHAYIKTAPLDIGEGMTKMDVFGFIPDFQTQTGDITLAFYTKDKPGDSESTVGPYTIATTTKDVHLRLSGRQAAFQLTSNTIGGNFRLGKPRLLVQPAGQRR